MKKQDNEQLCALAQKGDTEARDLLLKNNLGFIRKTANEIYLKSNLAESSQYRNQRSGTGRLPRSADRHPSL